MAKGWMTTLKNYFSLLNRLYIDGDITELRAMYYSDRDSAEQQRLKRCRDTFQRRQAKTVKSKTTITNIHILSEDRHQVELLLNNHVWKLYHINHHFMEQEDEQVHKITLKISNNDWLIDSDDALSEPKFQPVEQECFDTDNQEEIRLLEEVQIQDPAVGFRMYNRVKAKRYAELWWNRYNPHYPKFEVDCTNFVSQCLHEGGLPMNYTGQRNKGWWVQGKSNWSFSWSVANSLMIYLLNASKPVIAEEKKSPDQLMIGDVICYDWDGNGGYQHNTTVVAKDPNGMPLVNAHTTNSRHRYWDYQDSYAWTENTKYKFIHIKG